MTTSKDDIATLDIRIARATEGRYAVEMRIGDREFPEGSLGQEVRAAGDAAPTDAGVQLFSALIADARVHTAWELAAALHPRRRIRLRIDDAAPELHALAWEALHDPSPTATARFVAADRDTPFSRHVACAWEPPGPVAAPPIRVLTAVAAPAGLEAYGLAPIDVDRELAVLADAMGDAAPGLVEHTALPGRCTLAALEAALEGGYHILHLVAHGVMRGGKAGGIATFLELPDGAVDHVDATRFAAMVERLSPSLRLAVLMSCNTAARSPEDPRVGFAPALLAAGVPAVLAMQDRIPMDTAAAFTRAFYRELWTSGEIDRAANRARAIVLTERLPGGSIPVLYAIRSSLRLWSSDEAPVPAVAPAEPDVEAQRAAQVVPAAARPQVAVRPTAGAAKPRRPASKTGWSWFGGPYQQFVPVRHADRRLEVFACDEGDVLWYRGQDEPGGAWGEWQQKCTGVRAMAATSDGKGRLSLFTLAPNGTVWQLPQTVPSGEWGEWVGLGGDAAQVAAACRKDGKIVVVTLDGAGRLRCIEQSRAGGSWGEWYDLRAGEYTAIAAVRAGTGDVEVFALDGEGHLWSSTQRGAGREWDSWTDLTGGAVAGGFAVTLGYERLLELVVAMPGGSLHWVEEQAPARDWGEWDDLGGEFTAPAVLYRRDESFEVYAVDPDGAVWRLGEDEEDGEDWGEWQSLGGQGSCELRVVEDANDAVVVFARDGDGSLQRWVEPDE